MVRWIWVMVIWLMAACDEPATQVPAPAVVAHNTNRQTPLLPPTLTDYLKTNLPQWQVVEKTDYSKTWWSFYDSSYNPCWARTDINDDQLADYALWLKKDNRLCLVICTGTSGHSFVHSIVNDINIPFNKQDHNLTVGIAVAPPAQIDIAFPRIQSLMLRSNGFAMMELEERTRIWYWENDGIQTFYMK